MIKRQSLVARHNPGHRLNRPDSIDSFHDLIRSPLSVGNGQFAFTADITGLQTFDGDYDSFPLTTMSQWGWHTRPGPFNESDLRLRQYDTFGRPVGYASDPSGQEELFDHLRQNPHRLHLASIGFLFFADACKTGVNRTALDEIRDVEQTLNLWDACLHSRFSVQGKSVATETTVDSQSDTLAVRVSLDTSWDLAQDRIGISMDFPYGSPLPKAADWTRPDEHRTIRLSSDSRQVHLARYMDGDAYFVAVRFEGFSFRQAEPHRFVLEMKAHDAWITFSFAPERITEPIGYNHVRQRTMIWWQNFWTRGGAIDLHHSGDRRADELERRIVLSQYLTAIHCAGQTPPAESGLICNSWYGKFHLEMHPWHAAHFALWGHADLLERSMDWYLHILPMARSIAASQGYAGARWPKMTDPSGRNSPSSIAVLLAWQQPHPILLSELIYQARPSQDTLEKYAPLVFETANFILSFLQRDNRSGRLVLGPPLIPAQETHLPEATQNPVFELTYFQWALRVADQWRARLHHNNDTTYRQAAQDMSALPIYDDVYIAHARCPETFTHPPFHRDHPSMLCAMGFVPGETADPVVMRRTLHRVLDVWDRDTLWGWDFPMMAMTCVRLGLPDMAIDMLMMDASHNQYLPNGHNPQPKRSDLPVYLPGNGGLLLAVATMAAGTNLTFGQCDWRPDRCRLPGFPTDKGWTVEAEGIRPYL